MAFAWRSKNWEAKPTPVAWRWRSVAKSRRTRKKNTAATPVPRPVANRARRRLARSAQARSAQALSAQAPSARALSARALSAVPERGSVVSVEVIEATVSLCRKGRCRYRRAVSGGVRGHDTHEKSADPGQLFGAR